ncbi:MAG: YxeA family protein [Actinomycetia bacterium]|nr:YxeA family protein [Actinomycetes bacterium]
MTKKPGFWIVVGVVVVLVVAAAVWGKQYYENRYVGRDYYAMVPLSYDITPQMMHDSGGAEVGLGKTFDLKAYNEHGEEKDISFIVVGDDVARYPQQGAFLLVNASNQIVLNWSLIDKGSIPAAALAKIEAK